MHVHVYDSGCFRQFFEGDVFIFFTFTPFNFVFFIDTWVKLMDKFRGRANHRPPYKTINDMYFHVFKYYKVGLIDYNWKNSFNMATCTLIYNALTHGQAQATVCVFSTACPNTSHFDSQPIPAPIHIYIHIRIIWFCIYLALNSHS